MNAPPPCHVTFRFPPPGFFLNSPSVRLVLDDQWTIFHGSFVHGFQFALPIAPGTHRLSIILETGLINRTKHHWLALQPGLAYDVLLDYSRFWGNFGAPKVTPLRG